MRHVVGNVSDFSVGSHRVVEIDGRGIGIFNVGGELYALPNICPHQSGPVCEGRRLTGTLEATAEGDWRPEWVHAGEIIACPWHGLEYHVPTGRCLAFSHIRLRRYPVSVEGDVVAVELPGAPAPGPA
jgi:nitrite reductase (NADH) small subunit